MAVAGVCRSWRQVVLQQQQQEAPASAPVMQQKSVTCYRSSSTSSSSLIRFPASIRRQAATDCPLQCVLKKKGNSFFFFQSVQDDDAGAVDGQEEYFLLAARKRYMPSCSSFEISTDTKSLVQKGTTRAAAASGCSSVQASVKSNFSRSEFVVLLHNNNEAADPAREKSPLRVKYSEEIVDGARQRKLSCGLKSPATSSSSSSGTASTTKSRSSKSRISRTTAMTSQGAPSLPCNAAVTSSATRTVRSFLTAPWSCFLNTRSRQVSRSRVHSAADLETHDEKQLLVSEHHAAAEKADQDWEAAPAPAGRLSLKSKAPEWNQERGCWSLDFKGRATMASIHNFQLLVSSSDSVTSSNSAAANPDHQRVVLQMGKVGKGTYLVDVFSPLSALDAFSICLTSFATNVGLEP